MTEPNLIERMAEWDAEDADRHRGLYRAALSGSWPAGTVERIAVVLAAARQEGHSVIDIAEWAGLSRQGAYAAIVRCPLDAAVGTRYALTRSARRVSDVLMAADQAAARTGRPLRAVREPSAYSCGSVRRIPEGWVAEVGMGGTLEIIPGRHDRMCDAVTTVLEELERRRCVLRDLLDADADLWPLAWLVAAGCLDAA